MLTAPLRPAAAPPPARSFRPLIAGATVALFVLIIGVVWILPDWVAERPLPAPESAAREPAPGPPPDALQRAEDKRAAEAMLGRLLRRQAQLTEASVEGWARDDYSAALLRLAAGDVAFAAASFGDALTAYTTVAGLFDELEASRPRRLAAALQAGAAAFDRLEADAAARHYRMAVALDPDNAEAAHGLERAQHLDAVLAHVKQGEAEARDGRWRAARDAFAAAVALDPEYAAASSGLRRAGEMLLQLRFERRISAFYQALSANRLVEAKTRLDEARELRPGADEIAPARRRLGDAIQQAALESLRAKAAQEVEAEQWSDAVKTFSQALEIDPNVAFARQGLVPGQQRARLDEEIERYLRQPTRLYSRGPLARARGFLATAEAIDVSVGPRLLSQRQRLRTLVEQAGKPVTVAIASDGQTDVTVNRVATLGRFVDRRIDLLPGDYVVVGSRGGYRDVRVSFRVEPGTRPETIVVICRERL